MARSVTASYTEHSQVESAVGALRADGIEAGQISVTAPDGTVSVAGTALERHGFGARVLDHLRRHDQPHEQARSEEDHVSIGGWLVSVAVQTTAEDQSARNLLIRAGAKEISSATDGEH